MMVRKASEFLTSDFWNLGLDHESRFWQSSARLWCNFDHVSRPRSSFWGLISRQITPSCSSPPGSEKQVIVKNYHKNSHRVYWICTYAIICLKSFITRFSSHEIGRFDLSQQDLRSRIPEKLDQILPEFQTSFSDTNLNRCQLDFSVFT
jgi:hypothetical protein